MHGAQKHFIAKAFGSLVATFPGLAIGYGRGYESNITFSTGMVWLDIVCWSCYIWIIGLFG